MDKPIIDYRAIARDLARENTQLRAEIAQFKAAALPWWKRWFKKRPKAVALTTAETEILLEELRLRIKVTRLLSGDNQESDITFSTDNEKDKSSDAGRPAPYPGGAVEP